MQGTPVQSLTRKLRSNTPHGKKIIIIIKDFNRILIFKKNKNFFFFNEFLLKLDTAKEKLGFLSSLDGKESACNARDLDSVLELGGSPGEGHGNPRQCFCLENCRGQRSQAGYSPWGSQKVRHNWTTKQSKGKFNELLEEISCFHPMWPASLWSGDQWLLHGWKEP